jgi:hypothetical protein
MSRLFFLLFLLVLTANVHAQEPDLDALLSKTEKNIQLYVEKFKDLTAEETKTNKFFRKNGEIDETRIIRSLFIVYQSPRNGSVDEFRNVLEFNGKKVGRSDEEIGKFFEKLAKASSFKNETEKLRKESNRYDGPVHSWGVTLDPDAPLGTLRPFFNFKVLGRETVDGHETVVVGYEQIKPTTRIMANPTEDENKISDGRQYNTVLAGELRPTNPKMSGKLWLDNKTGALWKNEFQIALYPAGLSKAVVSVEISYTYQASKFGILVPKAFRFVNYRIERKTGQTLKVSKQSDRQFEYSNFSSLTSEIERYEVGK